MRLPPVKPRTRLTHEAAHWARAQGRFDDYHEEIFRAFFERGKDIGDMDVLVALALAEYLGYLRRNPRMRLTSTMQVSSSG